MDFKKLQEDFLKETIHTVYQKNRHGTFTEYFQNVFPATAKLLTNFQDIVLHFIDDVPSLSSNINEYGAEFPLYLSKFLYNKNYFLRDLASLEWCIHRAYFLPDNEDFDFSFSEASDINLILQKNIQLFFSEYAVDQVYKKNKRIDLNKATRMVIFRRGFNPELETVSENEWRLLKLFSEKKSLLEICNISDQEHLNIVKVLPNLVQKAWLTRQL